MPQGLEKLIFKQGYCYLANMNPTYKSKPGKVRPVVVVQASELIDADIPGVVALPITSQIQKPDLLRVHILPTAYLRIKTESDVLINQVLTLDQSLFLQELGRIEADDFQKIMNGLKFLLGIRNF